VGRQVCVLGSAVAENLFPGRSALDQAVEVRGQHFTVIGVLAKQGEFLGLFSFDNQIVVPLLVGIVTTVWFTWGGTRDLIHLFRALPHVKRDARDDGTVVNHHNLDEAAGPENGASKK
jgi:hypothetical protein